MNKLIILVLITFLTSCNVFHDINLSQFKIGMTQGEVLKTIGKDSTLIEKIYAITFGFCRADIWEYGNRDRHYLMTSNKFLTPNPKYKALKANKERYWFYFYNQRLELIKWGQPKDWNGKKDIDSLIVRNLRDENSDKLEIVLKIMKKK